MKKKNAFTLVELLAVIVILAIILVIAVPKIMSVIEDTKKAALEGTTKMIANAAEKQKVRNKLLNKTEQITCDSVAETNDEDYAGCNISFDGENAKVTIVGAGKFAGLSVCNGTTTEAKATNTDCGMVGLEIDVNGGNPIDGYADIYAPGSKLTLVTPTHSESSHTFDGWLIVSGEGASIDENNILTIGTTDTVVKAQWFYTLSSSTPVACGGTGSCLPTP